MRTGYWIGLLLACAITVRAQLPPVPYSFNYQGVLRDGAGGLLPPPGLKNVTLQLYAVPNGTPALWGRSYAVLLDTNGLFNVGLSDTIGTTVVTGLSLQQVVSGYSTLFLGLTVENAAEIAPRQQLLSVPFALMAGDVRTTSGGFTVNGFLTVTNSAHIQGGVTIDSTLQVGARITDQSGAVMPVGAVLPYAGTTPPVGWLVCNGGTVSRATYADLFNAIGTTYDAGDNKTTFGLPDMRGRTAIGEGLGKNLTFTRFLGGMCGEEIHTLSNSEMPAHTHGYTTYSELGGYFAAEDYHVYMKNTAGAVSTVAGGNAPHNNMQPSLVLKYIIKY